MPRWQNGKAKMSAALARSDTPRFNRPLVLVGAPRPSSLFRETDAERVVVGGFNQGNWQDTTNRLAALCGGGRFRPCGCSDDGSACSCKSGGNGNGGGNSANMQGAPKYDPNHPAWMLAKDGKPCMRARWVPITITNPAVVGAGGVGQAEFRPEAAFKLARMTLTAAQSADFFINFVAVGPTQNVLPGGVDGTYFSVASNQDGDGRIDSPIADPGQSVKVNFTSTAGVAAGAARITLQGAYAGQLDPHY